MRTSRSVGEQSGWRKAQAASKLISELGTFLSVKRPSVACPASTELALDLWLKVKAEV